MYLYFHTITIHRHFILYELHWFIMFQKPSRNKTCCSDSTSVIHVNHIWLRPHISGLVPLCSASYCSSFLFIRIKKRLTVIWKQHHKTVVQKSSGGLRWTVCVKESEILVMWSSVMIWLWSLTYCECVIQVRSHGRELKKSTCVFFGSEIYSDRKRRTYTTKKMKWAKFLAQYYIQYKKTKLMSN